MGHWVKKGYCCARSWSDGSEALDQCQTRLDIVKAYLIKACWNHFLGREGSLGVFKGLKKAISDLTRLF